MNRALKTASEESRTRQEQVPNTRRGEVKCRGGWTRSFQNLQIQVIEKGSYQLLLGWCDRRPQRRGAVDNGLPVFSRSSGIGIQPVIEEGLDCSSFGVWSRAWN